MINFYKYEGAGNDFVMIDNTALTFKSNKVELAQKLCDRHFGIGSDGLIFIEKGEGVDFIMDFYNPDGSQSFCGNGSRCAVAFASHMGLIDSNEVIFRAIDGKHEASIIDHSVMVSMADVNGIERIGADFFLNTGSPHYIKFVPSVNETDLIAIGRKIRYDSAYEPSGTNVNIVHEEKQNHIAIRTYERGVENETLACGTGATAAALAYAFQNSISNGTILVDAVGGRLSVSFESSTSGFKNIFLQGPAKQVYKGSIK